MRRIFSVWILVILVFQFFACSLIFDDDEEQNPLYTSGDIQYLLDPSGNAMLSRYIGSEVSFTIPSEIDGHLLTTILGNAFIDNMTIEAVVIPNSVTMIEGGFSGCTSLQSITIPASVKSIGNRSFMGASALSAIYLSPGLETIGNEAFKDCVSLTTVLVPEGVLTLGDGVFANCSALESVALPESTIEFGAGLFTDCTSLYQVVLGSGLTAIPETMFANCTSFSDASVMEGVTSIGAGAFSGSCFVSLVIPEGVTSIGDDAFNQCQYLTDISLPDSLLAIGYGAFRSCINLEAVSIPAGVEDLGNYPFFDCWQLGRIDVDADNKYYVSIDGVVYSKDMTRLVKLPPRYLGSYALPETVTAIDNGAMSYYIALGDDFSLENVTTIGEEAFCWAIVGDGELSIPASVVSIGQYAFCTNLPLTLKVEASEKPVGWDEEWYFNPLDTETISVEWNVSG